jgi:hypothetical protein
MLNAWDNITLTLLTVYFLYWDKNWFNLYLIMTVLGAAALLFMILVSPENPKWLLSKGKHMEAINALNKIAQLNGSKNRIEADAIFVEYEECGDQRNMTVLAELSRLVQQEKEVPFAKSTNMTIIL